MSNTVGRPKIPMPPQVSDTSLRPGKEQPATGSKTVEGAPKSKTLEPSSSPPIAPDLFGLSALRGGLPKTPSVPLGARPDAPAPRNNSPARPASAAVKTTPKPPPEPPQAQTTPRPRQRIEFLYNSDGSPKAKAGAEVTPPAAPPTTGVGSLNKEELETLKSLKIQAPEQYKTFLEEHETDKPAVILRDAERIIRQAIRTLSNPPAQPARAREPETQRPVERATMSTPSKSELAKSIIESLNLPKAQSDKVWNKMSESAESELKAVESALIRNDEHMEKIDDNSEAKFKIILQLLQHRENWRDERGDVEKSSEDVMTAIIKTVVYPPRTR